MKPNTFLVERFTSHKGGHEYGGGLRFDAAGMTVTVTKEDGAMIVNKMELSGDSREGVGMANELSEKSGQLSRDSRQSEKEMSDQQIILLAAFGGYLLSSAQTAVVYWLAEKSMRKLLREAARIVSEEQD